MFPNLLGMKAYYKLTSEEMGKIIGTSRQTFDYKMQRGGFTPSECKAFCKKFNKSFDFLFATVDEAGSNQGKAAV